MSRSANRILSAAAAAAAAAAVGAGCGGREEPPDLANGKGLFAQKCGSCHTLARVAVAKGIVGPNLDDAFVQARRDGLGEETIEGVVRDQIANVRRNSVMPANLVTGDDARDVAAYVAEVAGVPGEDTGELAAVGQPEAGGKPVEAKDGVLEIAAAEAGLAFAAKRATATAGRLELVMENPASVAHNIAVKDGGFDRKGPVVGHGGTSRLSVTVGPGKYRFYCSVPGHEQGGMFGELTVR